MKKIIAALIAVVTTASFASAEDTATYGKLLEKYVSASSSGIHLVDYASWKKNDADKAALSAYLDSLKEQKPSAMTKDEAHVFWINLYNAETLKIVIDNYPVDSIRDIKSEGTSLLDFKAFFGPWRTKVATVEGKHYSLDDIEHKTIRPTFKDARSHYALNCASIGCPNLKLTPWSAATLEADLEAAASDFVNHPRGVTVSPDGKLNVSSIYVWFEEDFGSSDQAVIGHLQKYAKPDLATRLDGKTKIASDSYDWALNDQKSANAIR